MTKQTFLDDKFIFLDFDSTVVKKEGLDELAIKALAKLAADDQVAIIQQIKEITNLGMEGKIGFAESLSRRIQILKGMIHKKMIEELANEFTTEISTFFLEQADFFHHKAQDIFIISGGFREIIEPTAAKLEIPFQNIFANRFSYDPDGIVIGFKAQSLLIEDKGKVKQIAELQLDPPKVIVVGDGSTDRQIKEVGLAKYFFAFTENVERPGIMSNENGQQIVDGTQIELQALINDYLRSST